MKRILIVVLAVIVLTGCETPQDPVDGDINCDDFPWVEQCENTDEPTTPGDDIVVGDKVGYIPDVDPTTNRDLVSDSCDYLDNIGEWQPVWCDEFDYIGLPDSDLWSYDVGGDGWGNNEKQYYTTNDEDNAYVNNGVLKISAIKEQYGNNDYTSARLVSKNKGDFLYGKIQVKAKLPEGRGLWPAIWMLPTNWEYGGWPDSGEIDIMEYVGYDPNIIHTTIHTLAYNHSIETQIGVSKYEETVEEEFNVYEIEWEPGVIYTYLNGEKIATFEFDPEDNVNVENYKAFPFDKDFHLLLNVAVGGFWGGAMGIDDSIFPQSMLIDYVRVYQKNYTHNDMENPTDITNLKTGDVNANSAYIMWDKSTDDRLVKEYEITINNQDVTTRSLNAIYLKDLDPNTSYSIEVSAVDFTGNKSQPSTVTFQTPVPPSINERVEAEDFTTMSGIQTQSTSDSSGNLNVGWIDRNDTLEYSLLVEEAGTYFLDSRCASLDGGGEFNFLQDGTVLTTVNIDSTGGWQTWDNFQSDTFYLEEGIYTFTIDVEYGGFNINYFDFKKVS